MTHLESSLLLAEVSPSHTLVSPFHRGDAPMPPMPEGLVPGDILELELRKGALVRHTRLAKAGTARAAMFHVALEVGANPYFSDEIRDEVAAIDLEASLRDPSLEDLTDLPFVTIDGPTSRDLDQALYVATTDEGFAVDYALADAAHFVPKKSALFREALARGASVYLPGFSVPMLPRELSEGMISLNPDGPRRSLVFRVRVDAEGRVLQAKVVRAKVRSRAKLSFPEVQAFYDTGKGPLAKAEFTKSLKALRGVGDALAAEAKTREVARYRRGETEFVVTGENGETLELLDSPRAGVELYNEQLSLLVNREGAKMLLASPVPHVQPIYRVHPSPAEERLGTLREVLDGLVGVHHLGEEFCFDPEERSLAEFLSQLPREGREGRIADAVHRQAIVVNARSSFSADVGKHHGVGAEAYARYSAPMREIVGVFVHHEMFDLLTGSGDTDPSLRETVVVAANRSKDTQRKANDLVARYYLDHLLAADITLPPEKRPRRRGTVMGFTTSKLHIALEDPPLDVKLYLRDVGRTRGGSWLVMADGGASLRDKETGKILVRLGDLATVFTEGRDEKQDRWVLQLGEVVP
jgi:ribonuclease R